MRNQQLDNKRVVNNVIGEENNEAFNRMLQSKKSDSPSSDEESDDSEFEVEQQPSNKSSAGFGRSQLLREEKRQ